MRRLLTRLTVIYRALGLRGAFKYLCTERFYRALSLLPGISLEKRPYRLYVFGSSIPLFCRFGTSDRSAFCQVFVEQEYSCAGEVPSRAFVIDCGANVGYASAYFLMRFPSAELIAIEPDFGNFEMLQRNLEPYGTRAQIICSGVWSKKTGLVVCRGNYRDGLDWSIQVRECRDEEPAEVFGLDIGSLLESSGRNRVDVLKVDIEGSELEVFTRNYSSWIERVDTFIIELHDEQCRKSFFAALGAANYQVLESGELTMVRRLR